MLRRIPIWTYQIDIWTRATAIVYFNRFDFDSYVEIATISINVARYRLIGCFTNIDRPGGIIFKNLQKYLKLKVK